MYRPCRLRVIITCLIAGLSLFLLTACDTGKTIEWYRVTELYTAQNKLANTLESAGFSYTESMVDGKADDAWVINDKLSIGDTDIKGATVEVEDNNSNCLSKQDLADGKSGEVHYSVLLDQGIGTDISSMKAYADKVCEQVGYSNAKAENDSYNSYNNKNSARTHSYFRCGRVSINNKDVYWLLILGSSDDGFTALSLYASDYDYSTESFMQS